MARVNGTRYPIQTNAKKFGGVNTRAIVREVSKGVENDIAKYMRKWARNLEKSTQRKSEISNINKETAAEARQTVQKAYASSGIGKRPSYRQNDSRKLKRYSAGAMERALGDEKVIYGDAKGIFFIDKKRLDRTAKQWYRLNFGAQPKGRKAVTTTPMRFFGRPSSKRFNLDRYKASDPFLVPRGFFSHSFFASSSPGKNFEPGTKKPMDAFYLKSKKTAHRQFKDRDGVKVRPNFNRRQYAVGKNGRPDEDKPVLSKGIKGYSFIDKGAQKINTVYPKKIEKVFRGWEKKARLVK